MTTVTARAKNYINKATPRTFEIDRGEYTIKCGLSGAELEQAQALRADVFCRELGWVASPAQQLEHDEFDDDAVHLGILVGGSVKAYLRVHLHGSRWMTYEVFANAVPEGLDLRTSGHSDISRLAVAQDFRTRLLPDSRHIVDTLYHAVFSFCMINSVLSSCMIVSHRVLRALRRRGLPCTVYEPDLRGVRGDTPVFSTVNWHDYIKINRPQDIKRVAAAMQVLKEARRSSHKKYAAAPSLATRAS